MSRSRPRGSCGWTSRPREILASGGWTFAPGPRTRRQPRASTISGAVTSPRSVRTTSPPIAAGRDLEARVGLLPQRGAQLAIVEARPAPRQPEARRAVRGVEAHALQLLPDRALDAHLAQPRRRRRAGGRGALADLVAVDDAPVRAGAGELAGHREPGEAGTADQDVGTIVERRPLRPAQR